jgi:hypothetical protein
VTGIDPQPDAVIDQNLAATAEGAAKDATDPRQRKLKQHYELGLDVPPTTRVATAFIELAQAI